MAGGTGLAERPRMLSLWFLPGDDVTKPEGKVRALGTGPFSGILEMAARSPAHKCGGPPKYLRQKSPERDTDFRAAVHEERH
jgi:hypothetical protein